MSLSHIFRDSCVNSFDEAETNGHRKNFPFPARDLGVDLINNELKIAFVGRILENREPKVTTKVTRARNVENLFRLLLNLWRVLGEKRTWVLAKLTCWPDSWQKSARMP